MAAVTLTPQQLRSLEVAACDAVDALNGDSGDAEFSALWQLTEQVAALLKCAGVEVPAPG